MSHRPPGPSAAVPGAPIRRFRRELRSAAARNAHARPRGSLLAAWSWLVPRAALFAACSGAQLPAASAEPEKLLSLPCHSPTGQPESVVIIVSRTQILVGEDPTPVVRLPEREALVEAGVGAAHKRSPGDLFIVPLGSALDRERAAVQARAKILGQPEQPSEAVIVADGATPYRLLVEVITTLRQSGYGRYHLMTIKKPG